MVSKDSKAWRFYELMNAHFNDRHKVSLSLSPISDDWVKIDEIYVHRGRGKGLGTEAMKYICEKADDLGVKLTLEVEEDNPKQARLIDWYDSFDFEVVEDYGDVTMRRSPESKHGRKR